MNHTTKSLAKRDRQECLSYSNSLRSKSKTRPPKPRTGHPQSLREISSRQRRGMVQRSRMRRPTISSRKTIRDAKSAQERDGKKKHRPAPLGMTVLGVAVLCRSSFGSVQDKFRSDPQSHLWDISRPQGLKPQISPHYSARLKSCPPNSPRRQSATRGPIWAIVAGCRLPRIVRPRSMSASMGSTKDLVRAGFAQVRHILR
jgi:hypothetical protein